jgi:dihydroorotase
MIELLTRTPAELCGLGAAGYGSLREGAPGDVTVIDPTLAWTIDANAFASKSRNCPFHGWSVRGRATMTVVGGRVLHELTEDGASGAGPRTASAVATR